jgi:hypothetical protein
VFIDEDKLFQKLAPRLQRVLVIDPAPASGKLLQDLMRTITPGQLWAAPTEAKGLMLAQSADPQIIFVEHAGQDLDGARFTRFVRRSDFSCRMVPVNPTR